MGPILILSFWNPTPQFPKMGIFIHEHVHSICALRKDITFMEINVIAEKNVLFRTTISTRALNSNEVITINIYSTLWKFILINPWLLFWIINNKLPKIKGQHPRLIHSNIIFPSGIVGYLLAKKYKAKHIISEHWSKVEDYVRNPVFKRIILKSYRNSNAILCVSEFLASKVSTIISKRENIIIVPNIVDSNVFRYTPKIYDGCDCLRFFCIGTWNLPKRLDLIVDSLAIFAKKTDKKLILNIIGTGSQKDAVLSRNLPENLIINWSGLVEKTDILEIFRKTDFFLQASNIETFSIVTVEALSTGTPVLASNVGALPEFITPNNGILVDNTIDDWVNGLERIVNHPYNHQTIASEVSGKFTPEIVGRKISDIYDTLI